MGCSGYRIDLAVLHPDRPGEYEFGIECDGASYHSGKTARDRDRLRQQVLEALGWRIIRIWSTDWVRNPGRQVARVLEMRDEVLSLRRPDRPPPAYSELAIPRTDTGEPAAGHPQPSLFPEEGVAGAWNALAKAPLAGGGAPREAVGVEGLVGVRPYVVCQLPATRIQDDFYVLGKSQRGLDQMASLFAEVVKVESPVHWLVVCERVARSFGIARRGRRVRDVVRRAIERAKREDLCREEQDFFWRPGSRQWKCFRSYDTEDAPGGPDMICPEEVAALAAAIVHASLSVRREELVTETARALGFGAVGVRVRELIERAVDSSLADNGVIREGDEYISSAG